MTRLQKLQLRQSEARASMGALLDTEPEKRAESFGDDLGKLTKEMRSLEGEIQAALVAGEDKVEGKWKWGKGEGKWGDADGRSTETVTTDTPEDRELRQLIDGSNVGEIFDAALEKRSIDGATRELQQHFHLAANQVPLDLLETRAVTPAPADVGQGQRAIVPYVFPDSVHAFLGIPTPRVPVGEAVFPVLTSTLTVGTPAEQAEQAETTGAFSADVLSPSRIQASYFYSREDRSRFAGMDAALRMNLSEGLMDGLDNQILSGTNGLLTGTNLANHNVTAETTYPLYISQLAYSRVDGRYASGVGDLRMVVGGETYAHAAGLYRGNSADQHALARLISDTGGVRVSAHVPVAASNRQNVVVRLGMRQDAVAPLWEGVSIIPDEVTGAKTGSISITAVMLHAIKILRTAGFYKQQVQIA